MRTTRRTTLIVTVLMLLMSTLAFAGKAKKTKKASNNSPGITAVKTANDKITALLAKKASAAEVTKAVRDFIDIDELGKRSMVNHWSSMSATQKTDFLELLHDVIEDSYAKGMKANLSYTVDYKSETKQDNGDLLVKTEIKTKRHGHPFTAHVDYKLQNESGTWKAYDVANEGQWLVDNYQKQFDKIIAGSSVDDLIAKMQKKHDDNVKAASSASGTN
jgi:ABC-type transporter MlaC component